MIALTESKSYYSMEVWGFRPPGVGGNAARVMIKKGGAYGEAWAFDLTAAQAREVIAELQFALGERERGGTHVKS